MQIEKNPKESDLVWLIEGSDKRGYYKFQCERFNYFNCLETFLNLFFFLENTDYKTFDIRYMSPLSDISLTQYLSHSIGQKHLFEVRTMYPLQYTFYVWPENSVVMKYLLSMLASL